MTFTLPAHYNTKLVDANKEPKYWAMQKSKKAVGELEKRRSDFYTWMNNCGARGRLRRSWLFYNMATAIASALAASGDKGQYAMLYVNEFRTTLNAMFQLIIDSKPAWDPKALTTDSKALAECRLARTALDYYMRAHHLDKLFYRAVEYAGVLGEGFIEVSWDAKAGREVKPNDPAFLELAAKGGWSGGDKDIPKLHAGDLNFYSSSVIDMVRDPNAQNWEEVEWVIIRKFVNKYDLAARYPEHSDRIIAMQDMSQGLPYEQYRNFFRTPYKTDRVVMYTFWHKKTQACPEGRELRYLTSDIILEDLPLAYSRIPVFRMSFGETDGFSIGYTPAFDLCAVQDMVNNLNSTIATLFKAYGISNVAVPVGTRINEARLPEGMNLIETVGIQQFQLLNFLEIRPEMFNSLELYLQRMQHICGLDRPPPSASGSAQAMQLSMSQQFSQIPQANYETMFEDVGSMILECLKNFATVPRMIEIVGEDERAFVKEVSSKDFTTVHKVVADVSNPMSKTAQGRFQMAQLYVQAGQADNEELFNILENGKLNGGFEVGTSQEVTIQAENETLMKGQTFNIVPTDDDFEHLRLHGKALADYLADPQMRIKAAQTGSVEEKVSNAFMQHIQLHITAIGAPPGTNPMQPLKSALGYQQPNQPQGAALQGHGPPPGQKPPQGEGQHPPKAPGAPGRPRGEMPGTPKGTPEHPVMPTAAHG